MNDVRQSSAGDHVTLQMENELLTFEVRHLRARLSSFECEEEDRERHAQVVERSAAPVHRAQRSAHAPPRRHALAASPAERLSPRSAATTHGRFPYAARALPAATIEVIGPLLSRPSSGGRIVWTGRYSDKVAGGLDGWNCGSARLCSLLREASEVVVLDVLSFPWESLSPGDFDAPFVAVVPEGVDDAAIDAILGGSLLGTFSPFDRLVVGDVETRDRLQSRWSCDPRPG